MSMMLRAATLLAAAVLLPAAPAAAQRNAPPPAQAPAQPQSAAASGTADQQFAAQMRVIAEQRMALERRIAATTAELQRVAEMNPAQMDLDRISRPYREMAQDVEKLLDQLDQNGALQDWIDKARVSATTVRDWWARQPEDETQRGLLRQLDGNIAQFQAARQQLIEVHAQALRQRTNLLAQQLRAERIAATRQFEQASQQLAGVIAGLREFTAALTSLEQTMTRTGAAN